MNECTIIHIHKENITENLETKHGKKKEFKQLEGINLVFVGYDLSHLVTKME